MLAELRKEFQEIETGRRALRSFGMLVGSVLTGIGLFIAWKSGWNPSRITYGLGGVGGTLVLCGVAAPRVLLHAYRTWMGLAIVLGYVMTRLLLALVFFLVVTPTAVALRIFGKDPLRRSWEANVKTYWITKTYDDDSPPRLERYY